MNTLIGITYTTSKTENDDVNISDLYYQKPPRRSADILGASTEPYPERVNITDSPPSQYIMHLRPDGIIYN